MVLALISNSSSPRQLSLLVTGSPAPLKRSSHVDHVGLTGSERVCM
jgi:hypothetical protein